MIMTPEEICRHYQQAKHPQQDITVLADLNGTDKASIRAVLIDAGLCPPDQPDKGRSVRRGQYDDAIAALVSLGAEDKTIAAQVGCCVETVKKMAQTAGTGGRAGGPRPAGCWRLFAAGIRSRLQAVVGAAANGGRRHLRPAGGDPLRRAGQFLSECPGAGVGPADQHVLRVHFNAVGQGGDIA